MATGYSIATKITAHDAASQVLRNVQASIDKMSKSASRASDVSSSMWSRMKAFAGGNLLASGIQASFSKITSGIRGVFEAAIDMENSVANFIPKFGGSAEKATDFVKKLNAEAAATPFQFEHLAKVSDMLMGFGVATDQTVIPAMRMLGDIAGGNADKFNSIALAYSQVMAAGKANMQDMNQLINAGVPILGELAKMYGVNVGQIRNMISSGRVSSEEIEKAFKRMTSAGGMFYKGMEIQSQTFSGKLSTLKDNIKLTAAAVGGPLLDAMKPFVDKIIEFAAKVRDFTEKNGPAIRNFANRVVTAFKNIIGIVSPVFDRIFSAIGKAVEKFGGLDAIISLVEDAFRTAWQVVEQGYAILDGLLAPIGGVSGALSGLLQIVRDLLDGINDLLMALQQGADMLEGVLGLGAGGYASLNRTHAYQNWVQAERQARGMTPEKIAAMPAKERANYELSQKVLRGDWEKNKDKPMEFWSNRTVRSIGVEEQGTSKPKMQGDAMSLMKIMQENSRSNIQDLTKKILENKNTLDVQINVNQDGKVVSTTATPGRAQGTRFNLQTRTNP